MKRNMSSPSGIFTSTISVIGGKSYSFTGSDGQTWTVDKVKKGGAGTPSPTPQLSSDSLLSIQTRLMTELIKHFKDEIAYWLRHHGKGPLDMRELTMLQQLPGCLPKEEDLLERIKIKVDSIAENVTTFVKELLGIEDNKKVLDEIGQGLDPTQKPLLPQLSDGQREDCEEILCRHFGGQEFKPLDDLEISNEGINEIKAHEGVVKYVYNDMKGGRSRFCTEHSGHKKMLGKSSLCKVDSIHGKWRRNRFYWGRPTVGVGHLIYGETELQLFCRKEPLSDVQVDSLLKVDVKERASDLLKKAIKDNVKDAKLTQCQYDALVSIVFNRGIGKEGVNGFKSSTLWTQYIKKGNFGNRDPEDLKKIIKSIERDGSIAIVAPRRKKEAHLYANCNYTSN